MDGLDMRPVYLPVSLYLALSHMHTLLTYSITYPLSFLSSAADGMAGACRYAPSLCGEKAKTYENESARVRITRL